MAILLSVVPLAGAASIDIAPKVPQINAYPDYILAAVFDSDNAGKDVNIRFWNPNSEIRGSCIAQFNSLGYASCRYLFTSDDVAGTWAVDTNTGASKTAPVGKITFTETAASRVGLDGVFSYSASTTVTNPAKEVYIRSYSNSNGGIGGAVLVDDFDNDDQNEAVLLWGAYGKMTLIDQKGIDAGWQPEVADATDRGTYYYDAFPQAYDFDGDGYKEIMLQESAGTLYGFKFDGTTFSVFFQGSALGALNGLRPVICNLFPDEGMAVIAKTTAGYIYVYKWNQVAGSFDLNYTSPDLGTFNYTQGPICGDWDNDGDDDLVTFSGSGGAMNFFRVRDGQIRQDYNLSTGQTIYTRGTIADFDMDGNKEIFAALGSPKIYKWNGGTGSIDTNATLAARASFTYGGEPQISDINRNGYPDIIIFSSYGQLLKYEFEPTTGEYTDQLLDTTDINGLSTYTTPGIWDIDGDGFDEIFYGVSGSGNVRALKFDGNSFYRVFEKNGICGVATSGTTYQLYNLGIGFQGGDMDNDGDDEVFVDCQEGYYIELDARDVNSYVASIDYNAVVDFVDQNNMPLQQEFYAVNGTGYCLKGQNLLYGETNLTRETGSSISNSYIFTDGMISTSINPKTGLNSADYTTGTSGSNKWVNLLLSDSKTIGKLSLWRYYSDVRVFYDTNVLITGNSDCATGFTAVFDNSPGGTDGNYAEQNYGKDLYFSPQSVRCIRISSSGSNKTTSNIFVELMGFESTTDCGWNLAARASLGAQAGKVVTTKMTVAAPGNRWASGGVQTTLFTQGHYVWPLGVSIVGATEYASDENVQIVVYAEDADEVPVSGAACDVNIYSPDGSLLVTKGAAGEIANTGVYRYSLIAPATEGIYIARAQCSSGSYSAFDVHTFHIALWANIIPDLNQYIWNYGSRSLTDYNQGLMFNYLEDINAVAYDLNGNAWLSAADVWDYSARSLTDYNMGSLPAYVWSYSSRALTDYNMSTLPDYLWVYNTRTLTDYNMSTLPAFVWSNPTRSLTTLGIEQDRNFVQSPDDGYLQKSSGMGGSYLNALVATPTVVSTQAYLYIGQRYDMIGETFYIWNSYLTFDTSAIGNDENILSATLNMKLNNDYSTANFDILSYSGDGSTCWGNGGLTAGDWNSCYYNGVYDGNLISTENLPSADNWVPMSLSAGAINKDGNTQFELTSSRYQSTSTSMGNEYVQFYSGNSAGNEPYLEIKTYNSDMNLYSIWYFAQRTLTDYNMSSLPDYVWVSSNRSLTDYNMSTLPSWVWSADSRLLTDYNMVDLPAYLWGYPSRTLTDYNQSAMFSYLEDLNMAVYDINSQSWIAAADVWAYSSRALTDYNFSTLPEWLWTGASNRSLTDYNMSELPAFVWSNPARVLTDYNMAALPDYMWVYSSRSLTDYNMAALPEYVWSNPEREVTNSDINAFAVWNYAARALTDYNMSNLPAYIWVYPERTLSDYNQSLVYAYLADLNSGSSGVAGAVWAYASRSLTDYNMSELPAYVWAYDSRDLTDYNMAALPSYVWSNPERELTTADINAFAVWNFAQRALTDYNMSGLPDYIWVYPNRELTDYNFATIPDYIWSGATVRTLTDYNQSALISYLADINVTVVDINGGAFVSAADIWAYSTRGLTDYNYSTLPEWIWSAQVRELTTSDINAYAIWNYASRLLTDYNQSLMFSYLADINVTVIDINGGAYISAAELWSYSTRALTDYNQSAVFGYLSDINGGIASISDVIGLDSFRASGKTMYRYLDDTNSIAEAMREIIVDINAIVLRIDSNFVDYNLGTLVADVGLNYGAIIDVNTAVALLDVNSNNQAVLDKLDNDVLPDLALIYGKVQDYPYTLTCNAGKANVSGGGNPGLSAYDRDFITAELESAGTGLAQAIELMKLSQSEGFSALFEDTSQLVSLVEDVQTAQGLSNDFESSAGYNYLQDGLVGIDILVSNPFDFPLNRKFVMDLPVPLANDDVVSSGGANLVKVAGIWVVAKDFELGPKASGNIYLVAKNAWKREFDRVLAIGSGAAELAKSLDGTGYYSQAVVLQNDINEKLAAILDAVNASSTAGQLVAAYDTALPLIRSVDADYAELQSLASQSSGLNALGMAVMGGQVSSAWGIVLVVLMGVFVLLGAIYVIWKMNLMHKKEADVSSMVQTTILKELIRMNRGIEGQGLGEDLVEERLKVESLKEVNEEMVRELKKNIMTSVTQDVLKGLAAEKLSGIEKEAVERISPETEKAKNLLGKLEDGMKAGVIGRLKDDLQRELEREMREEMHGSIASEEMHLRKELEAELAKGIASGRSRKGAPAGVGRGRGRPKGKG